MNVEWVVKNPFVLCPNVIDCLGTIFRSILGLIVGDSSIKINFCLSTTFYTFLTHKEVHICLRRPCFDKENYLRSE